jgi:glycolate oxidase
MCVEMSGSLTGEHGIGMKKRDYLPKMFTAAEIDLMLQIRAAFDPRGVSNPCKMLPDGGARSLVQHGLHPLEAAGMISRE